MTSRSRFLPYALLPLLAAALGSVPAATDPETSLVPYHGVVSDLLAELVDDDPRVRDAAESRLLEHGEAMLPYVLHAAESRRDPGERTRFCELAQRLYDAIRAAAPPGEPFVSQDMPPRAEYSPFDHRSESLLAGFRREAERAAHPPESGRGPSGMAQRSRNAQDVTLRQKARRDSMTALVENQPGTPQALLAEERLLQETTGLLKNQVDAMEAFTLRHPGTEAAANGLEWLAFEYSSGNILQRNMSGLERWRAFNSAVSRLFEQRSGEGVSRLLAGELPSFFFQQEFDPTALYKELLAVTREFVACHFLPDAQGPRPAVAGPSTVEWSLLRLHQALGDPADDDSLVDREYLRLQERRPWDASVAWCRAVFHAKIGLIDRALSELQAVERTVPGTLYGRKALATRATVLYAVGRFREAAEAYARYAERCPDSSCAWLAALRAGHARLQAGDAEGALEAYSRAEADCHRNKALALLLPVAKAQALEDLGRYAQAATSLHHALQDWPPDPLLMVGTRLEDLGCIRGTDDVRYDLDEGWCREDLESGIDRLGAPGVSNRDLARFREGEHRVAAGDSVGGLEIFAGLVAGSKPPALRTQARDRVADLAIPMALAAKDPGERDRLLALAGKQGGRLGALAADVTRACLLFSAGGREDEAAGVLGQALDRWWRTQPALEPASALERDVDLLCRTVNPPKDPGPGDLYRVVPARVRVTEADGIVRRPAVVPEYGGESRVIHFEEREKWAVLRVLAYLGSERRRHVASVMAIPQPVGDARALHELVSRFLPVYPGHWGGWSMNSLPQVFNIEFEDAARSRALVTFAGGRYSGETVRVERGRNGYVITDRVSSWIE